MYAHGRRGQKAAVRAKLVPAPGVDRALRLMTSDRRKARVKNRKRPPRPDDGSSRAGSQTKNGSAPAPPGDAAGAGARALERRSFALLLVAVSLLFTYMLRPFLEPVFWVCVIGIIFQGPYRFALRRSGGRANLAALVTLLACVTLAVVPALLILGSFFREGAALYGRLQSGHEDIGAYVDGVRGAFPAIQGALESLGVSVDGMKEGVARAAVTVTRYIAQNTMLIGQGTLRFFISLALMLYLSFFTLRDGRRLVALLGRALPFGDKRERLLFSRFAEVTRATVRGNLVVAVIQGVLGAAIFWLLDIRGALFWGVVMTVLSLIPVVGAGLIWGPVAVYLFASGAWAAGVILTVFGVGVIGLVDNLLRPVLVGRDTKLPDYLVLLSTIGGFAMFGMSGFVLGPAVASLFVAVWEIFILEFVAPPPSIK